jgi:hypothetical protein
MSFSIDMYIFQQISSPTGLAAKRGIFIDGGIHAREWVSPATVIYTIEQVSYNRLRLQCTFVIYIHYHHRYYYYYYFKHLQSTPFT